MFNFKMLLSLFGYLIVITTIFSLGYLTGESQSEPVILSLCSTYQPRLSSPSLNNNYCQSTNAKQQEKIIEKNPQQLNTNSIATDIKTPSNPIAATPQVVKNESCHQITEKVATWFAQLQDKQTDVPLRVAALQMMSMLNSPETQQAILEILTDKNEHIAIRTAAINAGKWQDYPEGLLDIIQNEENKELKRQAVYVANSTEFSNEVRETFNQNLLTAFSQHTDVELQKTILDYFANKPTYFKLLAAKDNQKEVISHIEQITKEYSIFNP